MPEPRCPRCRWFLRLVDGGLFGRDWLTYCWNPRCDARIVGPDAAAFDEEGQS